MREPISFKIMTTTYRIKKKQIEGFTLIEMMVVVIIVGVLGAIAAPSWLSFLTRQKMNAVNSDLVSAIKDSQKDAIQQRSKRRLTFSAVGSSPSVAISYPDVNSTVRYTTKLGSDTSTLQLSVFQQNSSGSWIAASTPTLDFDYSGNVSSEVPYIVQVQPQDPSFSIPPRCVIVTTLLGGLNVDNGDMCNTFSPD